MAEAQSEKTKKTPVEGSRHHLQLNGLIRKMHFLNRFAPIPSLWVARSPATEATLDENEQGVEDIMNFVQINAVSNWFCSLFFLNTKHLDYYVLQDT